MTGGAPTAREDREYHSTLAPDDSLYEYDASPLGSIGRSPLTILEDPTPGTQVSAVAVGDLDSDFKEFGYLDDEATTHVGGLPSAVRAGTGLSVSGYPFFASDTVPAERAP